MPDRAQDEPFNANPIGLGYLLAQIDNRNLALPNFQRDFVWDAQATKDLLASVASTFPAGTLLFLQQGSQRHFKPKNFVGAPELNGHDPGVLVLDGQQRLTALYQGLYGKGEYVYFICLEDLRGSSPDIEAAISYLSPKKATSRLGTYQDQATSLTFPLALLREPGFEEWLDEVLEVRERADANADTKGLKKELRTIYKQYLKPILDYRFPVVDLPSSTSLDAVCKIFETINNTGVRLTVFELLVARFWPQGINLHGLWEQAKDENDLLEEFGVDPYWLLQSICLRSGGAAPSVKRSDVLELSATSINAHWDVVVAGASDVLDLLHNECGVLGQKWLPYSAVLIPLAAVWDRVQDATGPERGLARQKVQQYFWAACFTAAFDASPNSAAVKHYQELLKWLDGGPAPEIVRSFDSRFDPDLLLEARTGQRAQYRAVMALTLRHRAMDFHSGQPLTANRIRDRKIDAHHVFPRKWLQDRQEGGASPDLILNRALIDKETNRRLQAQGPAEYFKESTTILGEDQVSKIFGSHLIETGSDSGLRANDYETFILERQERLISELEAVLGLEIPRHERDRAAGPADAS